MAQATGAATPIPPSVLLLQPRPVDAATSKILGILSAFRPHRIPASGADAADIEHCGKQIASILDLCTQLLDNLNENLPLDYIEAESSQIADLKGDLLGALSNAAHRWQEDNGQFGVGA